MAIVKRAARFSADLRRGLRRAEVPAHAAAVAYHAFLALVPLSLALFGVAAFVGESERALNRVRASLEAMAPAAVAQFVDRLLVEAEARLGGKQGWVIAVSVLIALYFGSRAALALQRALAGVEGKVDARRGMSARLVALGLTLGGGAALLVTTMLLVAGGRLTRFVSGLTGADWLEAAWSWLRLPVNALGLYLVLLALYHWGPPRPLPRSRVAALVGTAGVLLASLGFGLYLALAPVLGATFAVLGAVGVALVWLHAGAFAIMLGAVVASLAAEGEVRADGRDAATAGEGGRDGAG